MLATVEKILIIGATSGLGEQFARRFHGLGKTTYSLNELLWQPTG
jgi:short-subunit dehydrogenase